MFKTTKRKTKKEKELQWNEIKIFLFMIVQQEHGSGKGV